MNFFRPEDFQYFETVDERAEDHARSANKLLSYRGVRVFGDKNQYGHLNFRQYTVPEYGPLTDDTHQALLINIEELPKPECAHEAPKSYSSIDRVFCFKCGIELKASWSPA